MGKEHYIGFGLFHCTFGYGEQQSLPKILRDEAELYAYCLIVAFSNDTMLVLCTDEKR